MPTNAAEEKLPTRALHCRAEAPEGSPADKAWFVYYAVDSMTRSLRNYPGFADYAGLRAVSSCEEAADYVRAYRAYSMLNPSFGDSAETAADDLTGTARVDGILPHLKIKGGERDQVYGDPAGGVAELRKPSPVVFIEPVTWLADKSSARFMDSGGQWLNEFCEPIEQCTATFLSKYWLLTAAHCMQNVAKQSVWQNLPPDPSLGKKYPYCLNGDSGQPVLKPGLRVLRGHSSWLIMWSSRAPIPSDVDPKVPPKVTDETHPYNSEYRGRYMGESVLGVHAYQHPHPDYDANLTPAPQDIALLGLDPSSGSDGFLPPDIVREGGTVYIRAAPGDTPASGLRIAGFGRAEEKTAVETPSEFDQQLNTVGAPPNLTWDTYFAKGKYSLRLDQMSGLCDGDSGGPLYKMFTEVGMPPRMVQYGVAGASSSRDAYGCPSPGSEMYWSRLESNMETIRWLNREMGDTKVNGKVVSKCQLRSDDKGPSNMYQCWGEPCDGTENLKCPAKKSCVGAGVALEKRRRLRLMGEPVDCTVCGDGTCKCIIGQCMPDPGKK